MSNGIMSGNRNDVIGFEETLDKISIKSRKIGRPRKKFKELYAVKGYDTKKISVCYEVKDPNFKAFLDFAIFFSNFKIVRF